MKLRDHFLILGTYNLPALIAAVLFFSVLFFAKSPAPQSRAQYVAPPEMIKYMTVGMNFQLADSLWLRALQDFDYCEEKINEVDCKGKSWLFQVLNLATEVDPPFESVMYQTGGLALTILISDYAGASIIFDKAVQHHPKSWPLIYTAAYHAQFEEKNASKAARLYVQAADNGAPPWTRVLAGRLASDSGDHEYAAKILQSMIDINTDEALISRLKNKLAEVQKK